MNTKPLTELQKKILFVVRTWQFENGASPSSRDIAQLFEFSLSWANENVKAIVDKGFLEYTSHKEPRKKVIRFPRGLQFPWSDTKQFPDDIFDYRDPYRYPSQLPVE